MKLRKLLRVAFSAACIVLCLLEVALWKRSFTLDDNLNAVLLGYSIRMQSRNGHQQIVAIPDPPAAQPAPSPGPIFHLRTGSSDLGTAEILDWDLESSEIVNWHWHVQRAPTFEFQVAAPHWSLALLAMVLGVVPWIRWSKRFGLRTLMIATTFVAVALGVATYAARK